MGLFDISKEDVVLEGACSYRGDSKAKLLDFSFW